ncbi:MAG: hypothetical protein JXR77_12845, partial [Lentisphaeria bacterium]|nr:hypothetical protein [Lentisphaeria bacterium]
MLRAFAGVEYKLAWMSGGPVGPNAAYRSATADLWRYALEKGTGIRGGGIDFQHVLFQEPAWGSTVDPEGYCVVDDRHPTIAEGRFRGDENEEYGRYWEWRFGPVAGHDYRHRICSLRGLQMRQNFQMVAPATLERNPELNRYVLLTQGRRAANSPDAWAYLRECRPHRGVVRNIERWLLQRDFPGSLTVAAERVDRARLPSDPEGMSFDFDARRTDVAAGQNGILLRLDRAFWPTPGLAEIKVTAVDRAPCRWWVAYTDAAGRNLRTPAVTHPGDGERKTTTFPIPSLAAAGAFPADAGFRRWVEALPDPSVNRVADGQFPATAESWSMPECYHLVPDPEDPGAHRVLFRYQRYEDTVHMDQFLDVRRGVTYRLTGDIRNDGAGLRPAIRVARMDWSTLLYLEGAAQGEWETVSGSFTADEDGTVRLQLFGQGRGNQAPGIGGESGFRRLAVHALPATASLADRAMDFRLETEGPGDLTVTLVRVIKTGFREP